METRERPDAVSRKWEQRQVVQSKFYPGKNLDTGLNVQCLILSDIPAI